MLIFDSAAVVPLLLALRCIASVEHTTELRIPCLHERYICVVI